MYKQAWSKATRIISCQCSLEFGKTCGSNVYECHAACHACLKRTLRVLSAPASSLPCPAPQPPPASIPGLTNVLNGHLPDFESGLCNRLPFTCREKHASKAAGGRTTIPLGKKAVNCIPVYDTTYHDEFTAHDLDTTQQQASAELMRSLSHAPTATVGCLTRSH